MQRIYKPYTEWEDYKNGMYEQTQKNKQERQINNAVKVLSNPELFNEILAMVKKDWTISYDVNLSNKGLNRKAWLGQAACSYKYKVTERMTRLAWAIISETQKEQADKIASKYIKSYEANYKRVCQRLGGQMLLQWNT